MAHAAAHSSHGTGDDDHHFEHPHEPTSLGLYIGIYVALMVLLVITVAVSYFDLGRLNIVIAMVIAVIKAVLVMLFFMHVLHGTRLTWVFSAAAFLWLGIMLALTLGDYISRGPFAFRFSEPGTPRSGVLLQKGTEEHR